MLSINKIWTNVVVLVCIKDKYRKSLEIVHNKIDKIINFNIK